MREHKQGLQNESETLWPDNKHYEEFCILKTWIFQIFFPIFSKQTPFNFTEPECYAFHCQIETDPGLSVFCPASQGESRYFRALKELLGCQGCSCKHRIYWYQWKNNIWFSTLFQAEISVSDSHQEMIVGQKFAFLASNVLQVGRHCSEHHHLNPFKLLILSKPIIWWQ